MAKWTHGIEGIEEIAVREWAQGLATLTPDHIKRGLAGTIGDEWPPSMGEFRKACLGHRDMAGGDKAYCLTHGYNHSPEPGRGKKRLPRANKTQTVVSAFDAHMGEVRDALHGKNHIHPGDQAVDLLRSESRTEETALRGEPET